MKALKKTKTPTSSSRRTPLLHSAGSPKQREKRALAKSYEAEKHLRKFCSVTSHELSNVLGANVGELDYGLTSSSTAERNRAMTVALHAAERALTLARNLRYFAVHTRLDVLTTDVA